MLDPLSPNVERLTRQYVDGQRFSSSDEVLVFAMTLFVEFEQRYHDQMGQSLQHAFGQIEQGEGLCLNGTPEINTFFDDMMAATRRQADPHTAS